MKYWINVKDRLPNDNYVMVCMDDGFVATTSFVNGEFELWQGSGEVVAWMPLPEPYTVEQPPCETCKHRCREWRNFKECGTGGRMDTKDKEGKTTYEKFIELFPKCKKASDGAPTIKPCELMYYDKEKIDMFDDMCSNADWDCSACWSELGFKEINTCGECKYYNNTFTKCICPTSNTASTTSKTIACERFDKF